MTLSLSLTWKLFFCYTVLGPFYRSCKFMRIRMPFDCMHFACFSFFCVYTEKDIKRNWTKPPYISQHFNPTTYRERMKNGGISTIMLKKFLLFTKSVAMMSV